MRLKRVISYADALLSTILLAVDHKPPKGANQLQNSKSQVPTHTKAIPANVQKESDTIIIWSEPGTKPSLRQCIPDHIHQMFRSTSRNAIYDNEFRAIQHFIKATFTRSPEVQSNLQNHGNKLVDHLT
jgi:hypothetical protein